MAGKFGSASAWLLVDGYDLLAAKIKSLRYTTEALQERSDGLGDNWEEHTPTGLSKVSLAQEGAFFDTATNSSHDALSASVPTTPQATVRVVSFGFAGQTAGEPFVGCLGAFTVEYDVLGQVGELTKANAAYVVTGQRDEGTVLQPLAVKTADWDTESSAFDYTTDTSQQVIPITSNSQANPSVITTTVPHGYTSGDIVLIAGVSGSNADINGERTVTVISTTTFSVPIDASTSGGTGGTVVRANSANGGAGYQHVTAFSGFTGYIGKVRDSADDVTYADLVTFADVTAAPAVERVTAAGTVDRYLAVDGDLTGSGSITVFIGFARG